MAIFNCKSCGGDLEIKEGTTVVTCEYCGRQQTVPSMDNEKKINLFNRANCLRNKCDFDKAASVYESIVAEFPQESEAYWGLCLCKFGIEYVDDPATANKIPTCHRTSYESIFDDQNFDMACENADALAVNQLRDEAKEIDRLQKEILEIVKNEQPFDVFICYKESDETGGRTIDSELAHDIYDVLTEKGYKVFYSRITLKAKLGQDYEPYIFSALNSAKVMLSIGTKFEYFNAVWVKNEWSRFLALMRTDKSKMLIPCYRDIDPYDMPKEFNGLQGQDLSSPRAFQDLVTNIERIIPKTTVQSSSTSASSSTDPLLKRAFLCLEDGDWDGADKCCEKILDIDPEDAHAYLVKLCAELKINKPKDIVNNEQPIDNNNNFKKALRFADEPFKKELESYNNAVLDRIDIERKNDIYNEAVQKMNSALTASDYKAVKEIFLTISGFKDANELADKCDDLNDKLNAQFIKDGIKKLNAAHSVDDYLSARELFLSSTLESSEELAEKCSAKVYDIACDLMKQAGSENRASEIVNTLRSIADYDDAEVLSELIEDGALEYYKKAKIAVRNNDFYRAEQFLSSISGFFDADDLAKCCKNVMRQNGSKDSEDYKKLQSFSQISGGFNRPLQRSSKSVRPRKKTETSKTAEKVTVSAPAANSQAAPTVPSRTVSTVPSQTATTTSSTIAPTAPPAAQPIPAGNPLPQSESTSYGETAVNVQRSDSQNKRLHKVLKVIIPIVLMIVAVLVIYNLVSKQRTEDFKKSYFRGIDIATVGELVEASMENPRWYASSWASEKDPDNKLPALCCDGKIRGVEVNLIFGKYETEDYVHLIYNNSKIGGKTMTESDAKMVISTFLVDYGNKAAYSVEKTNNEVPTESIFTMLEGGSSGSAPTTPKADMTEIASIMTTKVGVLIDRSTNVSESYMGYGMNYNGKYGTFRIEVMADKYADNVLNTYPTGLKFPIEMIVPGKTSCSLSELSEIFGSDLKSEFVPGEDTMDGVSGYQVHVERMLNVILSNGTNTVYINSDLNTPFDTCIVYSQN